MTTTYQTTKSIKEKKMLTDLIDRLKKHDAAEAALNYAKAHNIPKLSNGRFGIVGSNDKIADKVRKDFNKSKLELENNKEAI